MKHFLVSEWGYLYASCKSLGKRRGQSLIEVLVALAVAVIIASSVTAAVVISLSNSQSVNVQNMASEYAQQAMEIIKQIKDTDYTAYNNFTGNYCFASGQNTLSNTAGDPNGHPPALGGACTENVGTFVREIDIEKNNCDCGANALATPAVRVDKVKVTVAWTDNKCPGSGTVPSGASTPTGPGLAACSSNTLTDRIDSKYCHRVTLSNCLSFYRK